MFESGFFPESFLWVTWVNLEPLRSTRAHTRIWVSALNFHCFCIRQSLETFKKKGYKGKTYRHFILTHPPGTDEETGVGRVFRHHNVDRWDRRLSPSSCLTDNDLMANYADNFLAQLRRHGLSLPSEDTNSLSDGKIELKSSICRILYLLIRSVWSSSACRLSRSQGFKGDEGDHKEDLWMCGVCGKCYASGTSFTSHFQCFHRLDAICVLEKCRRKWTHI